MLFYAGNHSVVEVWLRNRFSKAELRLEPVLVPTVCQDITVPLAENEFIRSLRKQGKRLVNDYSDKGKRDSEIGLLIGSDYPWQVTADTFIRCPDVPGLVSMDTIFGWTLQGPVI